MNEQMKVIDVYPHWFESNALQNVFLDIQGAYGDNPPEWLTDTSTILTYGKLYIARSADKYVAPIVKSLFDAIDRTSEDLKWREVRRNIGLLLVAEFADKWKKDFELWSAEYNPLHNYDMTETETMTGHDANAGTSSGTGTSTGNGQNNVYGFNSSTAQPSESSTNTGTTTQSAESSSTNDRTETRTHTRAGNIGVMSTVDLITQQTELNDNFVFIDRVMRDIDKLLTLNIY